MESYLGEVLLKNGLSKNGYKWKKDSSSNIPLITNKNGIFITPIDKVFKKLANGKEDNVIYFHYAVMELNIIF